LDAAHPATGVKIACRSTCTTSSIFYLKTQAGWQEKSGIEHSAAPAHAAERGHGKVIEGTAVQTVPDVALVHYSDAELVRIIEGQPLSGRAEGSDER